MIDYTEWIGKEVKFIERWNSKGRTYTIYAIVGVKFNKDKERHFLAYPFKFIWNDTLEEFEPYGSFYEPYEINDIVKFELITPS